jgi:hypothetical protein
MWGTGNQRRHVGLLDNVLPRFNLLMVTARGDTHARVVGYMSYQIAVANGVDTEAVWAVCIHHR